MHTSSPQVLVFGGSGQIGVPLLGLLRDADWQVLALSRQVRTAGAGLCWLRGDFNTMPVLPETVDGIFSCGPLDHFAHWYAHAEIRCPRVIAFGSTSGHVKQYSTDADERDVARRLREAETALFAAAAVRGAAVTVLRPTLVYGAGRDATLSKIAALAARYGRFVLPTTATGLRQPVHVEDLAAAALATASASAAHGRAYDLPGGETLAYDVMVQRVLAGLQPPARLHRLPAPLFRMALALARRRGIARELSDEAITRMREDLVFDATPARRDFGYAPRRFMPAKIAVTPR